MLLGDYNTNRLSFFFFLNNWRFIFCLFLFFFLDSNCNAFQIARTRFVFVSLFFVVASFDLFLCTFLFFFVLLGTGRCPFFWAFDCVGCKSCIPSGPTIGLAHKAFLHPFTSL